MAFWRYVEKWWKQVCFDRFTGGTGPVYVSELHLDALAAQPKCLKAVGAIFIDFYWKLMNYMDLGGFLRFLGQGVGPACGNLWQPVAPESCPLLLISFDRRIEAWKLQSSRPGLMSWLVDLDGLDWLADWLIWIGMIERSDWHLTRSTL